MMNERDLYQELLKTEVRIQTPDTEELGNVTDYGHLMHVKTWPQAYDADARTVGEPHEVRGNVWSEAIDRCLEENGSVFIPKLDSPVYVDRPIVLHNGSRLVVHPETEIRLIVGSTGTYMVRNANVVFSPNNPVELCRDADTGILIEGGIWSDQLNEGRGRGGAFDREGDKPGSMGVFVLHNITNVTVRNVRFKDCSSFAIQIGNAEDFLIESIEFDESADGIHVEGPSRRGIIRHISGKTNDDSVALNAWDWDSCSITFGPITDILVEDVQVQPGYRWSELRLLSGTKVFTNGKTVDCDIRRCIYRDIRGVHTFKLYDQPNISNPDGDYADPIGAMADLFFTDIVVDGIKRSEYYDTSSDGVFDICNNIDGLSIQNIRLNYVPGEPDMKPYLVSAGPKSWTRGGAGEVYNPHASPVVRGLKVNDIYVPHRDKSGDHTRCDDVESLINERAIEHGPAGKVARGSVIDPVF